MFYGQRREMRAYIVHPSTYHHRIAEPPRSQRIVRWCSWRVLAQRVPAAPCTPPLQELSAATCMHACMHTYIYIIHEVNHIDYATCYTMLYYAIYSITLHYTTLCYVILYYIILYDTNTNINFKTNTNTNTNTNTKYSY